MSPTKKELYNLSLGKLKEYAKEYEIPGRSLYTAANKKELANKIFSAIAKKAKIDNPPSDDKSPPVDDGLNCDIPQNTCEKSSKYKKPDILALAKKCGITDTDGLSRKQLCERIAQRLGAVPDVGLIGQDTPPPPPPPPPPPVDDGPNCDIPQNTCEKSSKYKKPDIEALAKKCGITDTKGLTRKQLCERIAQSLAGGVVPDVPVVPDIPVVVPHPVDDGLNCDIPQNTCEKSKKFKVADIKELARKCGVTDLTGSRKKLCERITEKTGLVVVDPVDPVTPDTPPSVVLPVDPVTPDTPPSVVPPVVKKCYGGNTLDDLVKMKVAELKQLMDEAKIEKGRPTNKQNMADYLCAIEQNGRCDPEKGVDCEDDLVCDAQAKVCLTKALADKRKLQSIIINGKEIIGTATALKQLQKNLDKNVKKQPDVVGPVTPEKPPTPEEPPTPEVKQPSIVIEKLGEGTPVVDIEEILRAIQKGGDPGDISGITASQKAVFKCLGLIS